MLKPALLACLLASLSACLEDRVIGEFNEAGVGEPGEQPGAVTSSDELSARYALDIVGEWQATFAVASDFQVTMHLTVEPAGDTQPRSGKFSIDVSCTPGCPGEADGGRAGNKPPSSFDVEYWFLKSQPGSAIVILTGDLFDALGPSFGLSPQCGYRARPQRLECGPATFMRPPGR